MESKHSGWSRVGRLVILGSLALLVACTPTRTQKTVGEQVDDTTTTARVKSALLADPAVKGTQIDVEVFRGIVQLNGFVDSSEGRTRAAEVARGVTGVREVRSNLRLQESPRTAGAVVDDTTISARVKSALATDPRTNAFQVNVETRGGVVQLAGFVDSEDAKRAAGEVARGVEHVARVDNQLDVKRER